MSLPISQIFDQKKEQIFTAWKEAVRQDRKIPTAQKLSETALGNLIPELLKAMVTVLNKSEEDDYGRVVCASLEHGEYRAIEGYNSEEITREYALLRQTIFLILEPDLLALPTRELNRAYRLIDSVIDEASSQCFKQFAQKYTDQIDHLQQQILVTQEEINRLLKLNQDSVSRLAHEIKTPLNSIMGYCQLLLRQQRAQKAKKGVEMQHLERMLRSSRQMLQLINDSLEISRIEAGQSELALNTVEIKSLIASIVETVEPLAQRKGLQLRVGCDHAPQQVVTDATRLQQIIMNLLSNAVRYTEQGEVKIVAEKLRDRQWSLVVSDTGVGIAPEDQEQIFEPFFRLSKDQESTGLGLAIVQEYVQLLQGKLQLESKVGEGTCFTLTFPLEIQS